MYADLMGNRKKYRIKSLYINKVFSEIAASLGIRLYTVVRESHTIYCAYSTEKLMPLLRKCWEQMEFLNVETDDGMRHVRQKYNNDMHKKASKLNKQREEYGWGSDILGLVVDNPNKLRGERVDLLLNIIGQTKLIAGSSLSLVY